MSDDRPTIDLTYIGRALDRLTQEIATMREQMTVQTASIIRLDNTVSGQGAELRALISLTNRMLDRLRRVEERVDALEDRAKQ
ncbi:MAG: hypothetical protein JO007_03845 [Alphaproteobacteria bacterium]|nr:hypothetical protein [Alphaproteobacteria bacterium]